MLVCQRRVAAGDQPFTGVVGVGDLGQVLCIEQAHLQQVRVVDLDDAGVGFDAGARSRTEIRCTR